MDLRHYRLPVQAARPFRISQGVQSSFEVVICEATHAGVTGRGEAAPSKRVTGEDVDSVARFLDAQAPALKDLDARAVPKFLDQLHETTRGENAARCALDVALHDLAGKLDGRPARDFYGLSAATLETTGTVSFDEPAAMAAEAVDWWARGFHALKLKLGEARRDVERVAAVRKAVPHAKLRVDANGAWSPEDARVTLRKLVELGVEMVEEPLARGDSDALAELSRESPIAIYADESVLDVRDAKRLAEKGFRGGFNVKLQKAGGIRPAFVLLKEARARAYGTQIGCNLETGLGISAATQLLALADLADLDGNALLARDPFAGARARDGFISSADGPGVGAAVR